MSTEEPKPQRRRYPAVASFYAKLMPLLVKRAREHGYALAVHGSMATDLDLVAAPWTEDAVDAETLVESICELVGGKINRWGSEDFCWEACVSPAEKPHGRRAWSIYLSDSFSGPYIDLSVMPLQKKETP